MSTNNAFLTGIIHNTKKQRVAFVSDKFRFTLVNTDEHMSDVLLTPDEAGFIWGTIQTNYAHKTIAIYIGRTISFQSAFVFNTWNYIVMDKNTSFRNDGIIDFSGFQGIRFINGSLKSVNPPWALHADREKEEELNKCILENAEKECNDSNNLVDNDNKKDDHSNSRKLFKYIVYREYENSKKFRISIDGHINEWIFGSKIKSKMSLEKGISLENTDSILEIRFDENVKLRTFNDYYSYLMTFLSFLTFREAVPFEEIQLLYKCDDYEFRSFGNCYINRDLEHGIANRAILGAASDQQRSFTNSISVHILSDESFEQIIKTILRVNEKTIDLPMAIVPADSKDASIISAEKIKSICSSLEVEMDAAGIKLSRDEELNDLISNVKDIIKKHRDSDKNGLEPKTYDSIFGSISHWGDSLADRAIKAWKQNKDFMIPWLNIKEIEIKDEDIAALVKVRNDIIHRGFQNVEEKIGLTAYALRCLIYVLALKRMKVSDKLIKDIVIRDVIG